MDLEVNAYQKFNEKELYKRAISDYGKGPQKMKAIEELSELIQAICKGNLSNIAEEMADVQIMLGQLEIIYDNTKEVAGYKQSKLERLNYRLLKFEIQLNLEDEMDREERGM